MNTRFEFQGFETQPSFEQFTDELFDLAHPGNHAQIAGRFSGSDSAMLATWDKDFAV